MLCWSGPVAIRRAVVIFMSVILASGCSGYKPCNQALVAETAAITANPPSACMVDGCTLAPGFNFTACCNTHDVRYLAGGTYDERKKADLEFRQCIVDADHNVLAELYYYSVRLAGTPFLPTPWRWGFGWEYPLGYK